MESAERPPNEPGGPSFEQLSRLTDTDLMAHLRSGRNDALAVLFERYHRLILSVAYKILGNPAEAEDVMQSVFLEIYKVAGQFDASRGTAKVWLLQYAYHRSMNRREYLKLRGFYDRGPVGPRTPNPAENGNVAPGQLTLPARGKNAAAHRSRSAFSANLINPYAARSESFDTGATGMSKGCGVKRPRLATTLPCSWDVRHERSMASASNLMLVNQTRPGRDLVAWHSLRRRMELLTYDE